MLSRRTLLGAVAAVAAGAAWARDAEGRRALVLGGDLAEIAYAIGAGGVLVGADDTALWPPEAAALPKVGYLRRISAEGVLSLGPDLVLASPAAGPPAALEQIRSAGIEVAVGPDGEGFDSVGPKIDFVGAALGRPVEAAALRERVARRMAEVEAALQSVTDAPATLFLISVANGAPMAAGRGTAADAMIRLARGVNVADGFEGYKPLSAEAAIGLAPETIVLPDHAAASAGDAATAVSMAGLGGTPAALSGRIVVMDGLKLLGFGPRTPDAVAELALALHPDDAARLDP